MFEKALLDFPTFLFFLFCLMKTLSIPQNIINSYRFRRLFSVFLNCVFEMFGRANIDYDQPSFNSQREDQRPFQVREEDFNRESRHSVGVASSFCLH